MKSLLEHSTRREHDMDEKETPTNRDSDSDHHYALPQPSYRSSHFLTPTSDSNSTTTLTPPEVYPDLDESDSHHRHHQQHHQQSPLPSYHSFIRDDNDNGAGADATSRSQVHNHDGGHDRGIERGSRRRSSDRRSSLDMGRGGHGLRHIETGSRTETGKVGEELGVLSSSSSLSLSSSSRVSPLTSLPLQPLTTTTAAGPSSPASPTQTRTRPIGGRVPHPHMSPSLSPSPSPSPNTARPTTMTSVTSRSKTIPQEQYNALRSFWDRRDLDRRVQRHELQPLKGQQGQERQLNTRTRTPSQPQPQSLDLTRLQGELMMQPEGQQQHGQLQERNGDDHGFDSNDKDDNDDDGTLPTTGGSRASKVSRGEREIDMMIA
ncbi:hypothetical protein K435DRAFT_109221 [Dendrothele bispora CBS 962.96]|uniref:Uncharacterized protein n=1 Tax=Dendrothele bispora (strain CBS 962.96) TaxID=1314807 RepID=A0A4S8M1R8_DENBC|nr:hypothetical protein K435DRAFT_109221 [Dendrothele bispora CBS 962.96]